MSPVIRVIDIPDLVFPQLSRAVLRCLALPGAALLLFLPFDPPWGHGVGWGGRALLSTLCSR